MHLKRRNKVSTVKWQGEKNNRRRSEINTGKTRERNGWGAFFTSFCSISHLSQQRNCSHATQGRWKFIQIFLSSFFFQSAVLFVLKILLLILIVSLSSSSPPSSSFIIIIIIIIITIFSSVHIFLAIYFLLD